MELRSKGVVSPRYLNVTRQWLKYVYLKLNY